MESVVWFTRRRENGRGSEQNWPSNFWIEPDGTTVEHEFQAEKHAGHPVRQWIILRSSTPNAAKRLGKRWKLTEEELAAWEDRKYAVMVYFLRKKIEDWPEVAMELIGTDRGLIVETNTWHDDIWGSCQCRRHFYRTGQNLLGKAWMQVRDEISGQGS